MATQQNNKIGNTKRTTDDLIADAVMKQKSWLERRRAFADSFFRSLNVFAKPSNKNKIVGKPAVKSGTGTEKSVLCEYWFPILCACVVICVTIWCVFNHIRKNVVLTTPEHPVVMQYLSAPVFQNVRVNDNGGIVIDGQWTPGASVSVFINQDLVATVMVDKHGDFSYESKRALLSGDYVISLADVESKIQSSDNVFVRVSGTETPAVVLLKPDTSIVLQLPSDANKVLSVSHIEYSDCGKFVVSGVGLPRMRVSISLDDVFLGTVRVRNNGVFDFVTSVDNLSPNNQHVINIRMYDSDDNIVAESQQTFMMHEKIINTYEIFSDIDDLWDEFLHRTLFY